MAAVAGAALRASRRLGRLGSLRGPAPRFCTGAAVPVVDKANKLIQDHGCVVFSKSTCPFCAMAKGVIVEDLKAKCHVLEMDVELDAKDMSTLQDHFLEATGARSVPRVFVAGKCIGGGSDVAALHESGKLTGMLKEAGAL
eukprot:gb/GFBE01041401.1/.p1 GENE.gb/GFBE01041401.1/~~gb/GFBE01041401.1/.p1  ORF type:complete len:141 (+),score=32.49 gb/GFBE01041401.1/:1-423(+)